MYCLLEILTHLTYIANAKNRVILNNTVTVFKNARQLTSFTTEK